MEAKVSFSKSGTVITIPKSGMAPMLFLEFLSQKKLYINGLTGVMNKVEKSLFKPSVFKIRTNWNASEVRNCVAYINDNS